MRKTASLCEDLPHHHHHHAFHHPHLITDNNQANGSNKSMTVHHTLDMDRSYSDQKLKSIQNCHCHLSHYHLHATIFILEDVFLSYAAVEKDKAQVSQVKYGLESAPGTTEVDKQQQTFYFIFLSCVWSACLQTTLISALVCKL